MFVHMRTMANYTCCLCQQSSPSWVCRYCLSDVPFFANDDWPHNLLLRHDIAQQIKHTSYEALQACGYYQWPFDQLIRHLKFNSSSICAIVLADWFRHFALSPELARPQCLLPVPIHYRRYLSRHFNQSVEIALWLSRFLHIPVHTQWARRTKGKDQHRLNRQQRLHNLAQAFEVGRELPYQRVAIVDDVVTTGSTVDALARLLKARQPDLEIEVWAMAVTLPPGKT